MCCRESQPAQQRIWGHQSGEDIEETLSETEHVESEVHQNKDKRTQVTIGSTLAKYKGNQIDEEDERKSVTNGTKDQGQDDEGLHGADAVEEQHDHEHEAHQGPEEWDIHQCLPTPVC